MDNVLYNQELQLSRFGTYLLKQQMVREGHERYFVFWIRKFLSRREEGWDDGQVCRFNVCLHRGEPGGRPMSRRSHPVGGDVGDLTRWAPMSRRSGRARWAADVT